MRVMVGAACVSGGFNKGPSEWVMRRGRYFARAHSSLRLYGVPMTMGYLTRTLERVSIMLAII